MWTLWRSVWRLNLETKNKMITQIKLKYDQPKDGSYYLTLGSYTSGYLFSLLEGFDFPQARIDIKDKGNSHGAVLGSKHYGRRVMRIEGEIVASSEADFETKRKNLVEACAFHNGLKDIIITTREGLELTTNAIVNVKPDLPYKKGKMIRGEFRIELVAPFPFLKSTTEQNETVEVYTGGGGEVPSAIPFAMTAGGGTAQTVENGGNVFAYPIIKIYGEIENPSILNETTGENFSLTYSLGAGRYIEIDVLNRTVKLDDDTNLLQYFSGDWITIAIGENILKLTGTNPSASAEAIFTFADNYLGI